MVIAVENSQVASLRSRAARLSLGAFALTAVLVVVSIARGRPQFFLAYLSIPALVVTGTAWIQYKRGSYTGAGAAAAAVSWTLVFVGGTRWGIAFFPIAVLQTAAWTIGRPRPSA